MSSTDLHGVKFNNFVGYYIHLRILMRYVRQACQLKGVGKLDGAVEMGEL